MEPSLANDGTSSSGVITGRTGIGNSLEAEGTWTHLSPRHKIDGASGRPLRLLSPLELAFKVNHEAAKHDIAPRMLGKAIKRTATA